jgi:hypothetical protein
LCAAFGYNSIEHVKVLKEVENCEVHTKKQKSSQQRGAVCWKGEEDTLFTATHSIISTYFGSMTIVLKLPLTSAASTNGLHRYKGFWVAGDSADGDEMGVESFEAALGKVAEVGVGERFGTPLPLPCIERLIRVSETLATTMMYRAHGIEKRHGSCPEFEKAEDGVYRKRSRVLLVRPNVYE